MTSPSGVVISHEMRDGEDFLATAGMLWTVVRDAAARYPGVPRELCLDAEIHGEHDAEVAEVLCFIRIALGPFLAPGQSEQLPDVIVVLGDGGRPYVLTGEPGNPVRDGAGMSSDRNLGTATVAAIYVRPNGAFAQEVRP